MKRFLFAALFLSLIVRPACGINLQFSLQDPGGHALGVKSVVIEPLSGVGINSTNLVTRDRLRRNTTSASGFLTVSNVFVDASGTNSTSYLISIQGNDTTTVYTNTFPAGLTGTVNSANPLYISAAVGISPATLAYSQTAADSRFVEDPSSKTSGQVMRYDGTNWSAVDFTGGSASNVFFLPTTNIFPTVQGGSNAFFLRGTITNDSTGTSARAILAGNATNLGSFTGLEATSTYNTNSLIGTESAAQDVDGEWVWSGYDYQCGTKLYHYTNYDRPNNMWGFNAPDLGTSLYATNPAPGRAGRMNPVIGHGGSIGNALMRVKSTADIAGNASQLSGVDLGGVIALTAAQIAAAQALLPASTNFLGTAGSTIGSFNGAGLTNLAPATALRSGAITSNQFVTLNLAPLTRSGKSATPIMMINTWHSYGQTLSITNIRTEITNLTKYGFVAMGYKYLGTYDRFTGGRAADGSLILDTNYFPNGTSNTFREILTNGLIPAVYTETRDWVNGDGNFTTGLTNILTDAHFFNVWGVGLVRSDDIKILRTNDQRLYYETFARALDNERPGIKFGGVMGNTDTEGSLQSETNAIAPWHLGVFDFSFDLIDYPTAGDTNTFWTQTLAQIDRGLTNQWSVRPGHSLEMDSCSFPETIVWAIKGRSFFSSVCLLSGNIEWSSTPDPVTSPVRYVMATNMTLIDINQDLAQLPASVVWRDGTLGTNFGFEIIKKPLGGVSAVSGFNGWQMAVEGLNRSNVTTTASYTWAALGIATNVAMRVKNAWTNSEVFYATNSFSRATPAYTADVFVMRPATLADYAADNAATNTMWLSPAQLEADGNWTRLAPGFTFLDGPWFNEIGWRCTTAGSRNLDIGVPRGATNVTITLNIWCTNNIGSAAASTWWSNSVSIYVYYPSTGRSNSYADTVGAVVPATNGYQQWTYTAPIPPLTALNQNAAFHIGFGASTNGSALRAVVGWSRLDWQ